MQDGRQEISKVSEQPLQVASNAAKKEAMDRQEDSIWMHCSSSAVRRASRQLSQLYDDVLNSAGLRGTQFSLLTQILYGNEPTQKALAEAMVMDLSALGHTLKPLIRDGLVELVPDAKDKRAKRVLLTAAGHSARAALMEKWQEAQRRFDAVLGVEKSEELRRTLAFIASAEFAEAFERAEKSD